MRHRLISVLLCFLCAFLIGCTHTKENRTDFTHPVTDDNVVKEPDTVYHWAQPSVFEDMDPVITQKTDRDSFFTEYALPEAEDDAVDCFSRHSVVEEENLQYGTYYLSSDGETHKACASAACREDLTAVCDHLTSQDMVHAAVWYGDSLYYIGTTLSRPSGRTVEWFLLRWKNGADSYEKLFSSDRLLTEIQFHGGILYLKAPRNYVGDNSIYYAVNIDAAVYTEIEVDGSVYRFGKDAIVKIDQTGAYFTNRFLEPIEKCSGEKYLGQVYGNYYYYLSEKTLYRTAQGTRGKAQKLAENIAAFTVCDGALFYMPDTGKDAETLFYYQEYAEKDGSIVVTNENAPYTGFRNLVICCADMDSDGRLTKDRVVFQPAEAEQEWIMLYMEDYRYGSAVQIQTVTAGDGQYVQYTKAYYLIDKEGETSLGMSESRLDADRMQ